MPTIIIWIAAGALLLLVLFLLSFLAVWVRARLAGAGLRRAAGQAIAAEEQARLTKEYETVWLRRSRPGGLAESVGGLFG